MPRTTNRLIHMDMRSAETPLHPGRSSIGYGPVSEPAPGLGVLCLVVAVLLLVSIGDTLVLVRGLRPGPFETGDIEPVSDTHPSSCSGHSDTAMQPCAGALLATALRLSSRPSSRAQIVVCWSRRAARRLRGWAAKWRSCRRDSPSRPQGAQEAQRHETLARRFQGPGLPDPTAPPLGLPLRPSLGHLLSQFGQSSRSRNDLAPALGT